MRKDRKDAGLSKQKKAGGASSNVAKVRSRTFVPKVSPGALKTKMFCPACKTLLKLSAHKTCLNCSAPVEEKIEFSEQIKQKQEPKAQALNIETMATVQQKCPKCGNREAYFKSQQIAYADEPETEFYKCTKCWHTWRSMYTM